MSISALIIAIICRLQPVHRAGGEGEFALQPDLEPRQHARDRLAVRAPPVGRAVVLAVGDPDAGLGHGEEAGERGGGAALGQDAGDQVAPPVVAVVAVRRALGVDLADRPVAVEHPGVDEVHEGQDVAAAVRVAQGAGIREARGDARDQRVGLVALVGDGDEEVEGDARAGDPVGDLVPEIMVEDMATTATSAAAAGPSPTRGIARARPRTGSGSSLMTRSSRWPIST